MAMRRIATSMIGKSPLRLSSSSSSKLGIASPLINRQSRSSSVPCFKLDEKPLTQGITTSEELERRIHGMKVRLVMLMVGNYGALGSIWYHRVVTS